MSEPDPQSDADRIRLKRLEKLQAAQTQAAANTPASTSTSTSSAAVPKPAPSPAPAPASDTPAAAAAASKPNGSAATRSNASKASTSNAAASTSKSVVQAAQSAAPSTASTSSPRPATTGTSSASSSIPVSSVLSIPYPNWFSGTVSLIFQITLSQSRAESSNWAITYLYSLRQELAEELGSTSSDASLKFDGDNLERAVVARLSMDPEQMSDADDDPVSLTVLAGLPAQMTNIEYLVGCWKRWQPERNKLGAGKDAETAKRIAAMNTMKRTIIENIGLQLQEPQLFPQPSGKPLGAVELIPPLLQLPNLEQSPFINLEQHQVINLLNDITQVYQEPSDLLDVLGTPYLQAVVEKLGARKGTMQSFLAAIPGAKLDKEGIMDLTGLEWRNVVRAVVDLSEIKPIANMFAEMPSWCPAGAPAQTFEIESLLGPLLRLGCFTDAFPAVAKAYFAQPSALSKEAIEASSNALRNTLSSLQGMLFTIFNNIVRSSTQSREAVLALFSHIIKLNNRRDGMRVNRQTVASDSFMINTFSVLVDFANPFMDAKYARIDKIDPDYYRKCQGRLDISEMTKIHATQEEAKAFYDPAKVESTSPPNFISEIFFLSTAFMHYGLVPAISLHEHLYRQLRHYKEDLHELEQNRQYDGTPQEGAYKQQVERMKAETEAFHARVLATEVQICDPGFIAKAANFSSFVMTWLVRLVDPKRQHPHQEISLDNLPEKAPLAFSMLPEYIVEDVTEFYFFISRYAPQTMLDMQKDQLLVFIVVFLCTSYINNPYLKGKFVEILYRNTRSWGPRYPRGTLGDTLNYHPLALKGLLPALMTIYCQIEFTGQHNQFYEKFEVRHQISKILRLIWDTKEHREAFKAEAVKEDFVRFVNYLLNDTTFMLDESLSKLKQIHDLQQEMADKATWDAQTEEQKKDKEKLFKAAEGQATSNLVYAYESLSLFKTLTAEAPVPFLRGEIVDRLTSSLDYNLNILAGPQCQELRVQDKEKYRFRPRELLGDIMQIIMNLADKQAYIMSTAKDGRSYSRALFENAIRIASRTGMKTDQQLQVLRKMVEQIEALRAAEAEEEEMGETPDEYLDPLTAEIMEDPVILPSSKNVLDFNTIKQHLLTVQQDPFNRTPLKLEELVRDDKLREEINAWRAKRRQDRLDRISGAQMQVDEQPLAAADPTQ